MDSLVQNLMKSHNGEKTYPVKKARSKNWCSWCQEDKLKGVWSDGEFQCNSCVRREERSDSDREPTLAEERAHTAKMDAVRAAGQAELKRCQKWQSDNAAALANYERVAEEQRLKRKEHIASGKSGDAWALYPAPKMSDYCALFR